MAAKPITWLPPVWTGALPGATNLAELYHENSKYHAAIMYRVGPQGVQSSPLEATVDPRWLLPEPQPLTMSVGEALQRRMSARSYGARALSLDQLAGVLGHAVGRGRYPSAGGLYPVDAYLFIQAVAGLPAGLYRYSPLHHGLCPLPGNGQRLLAGVLAPGPIAELLGAPLWLLLVADFPTMTQKYGARGYRFTLQESGHMAQNIQLVTASMGLQSLVMGAYRDDILHEALGLDGVERAVLAILPIGFSPAEVAPHGG
jgi:SagB-type dehydrogenase family enzyme